MATRVAVLTKEGRHPSSGILAALGEVHIIHSAEEALAIGADVLLLDFSMPQFRAADVLGVLRAQANPPLVLLLSSREQPKRMLERLQRLGRVGPTPPQSIARSLRLLDISQEAFARMLGVSARTAHRWLKGARPRRHPALERFLRLIGLLEHVLVKPEAIRAYLHHPNASLDGDTPLQCLLRGEFDRVEADLQSVQGGVYI